MTEREWDAIKNRDKAFDDEFFYAVKTTKTVCKPSCPSRTPNPENVVVFYSLKDAVNAGYRPCSRCRPESEEWQGAKHELAMTAKRYIDEHYSEKFSLSHLAGKMYSNPDHLLRAFRDTVGMTPLKYHNKKRCEIAAKALAQTDKTVEMIGWQVGFNFPSHFARVFKSFYGVSPNEYRKKGRS